MIMCRNRRIGVALGVVFLGLLPAGNAQGRRVACVGASNTYGYGLANREADCYPAQLAKMLRVFDSTWEVHNFGVNSTCVLQRGSLPYIRQGACTEAQAFNPDVVVIQLGGNDSVAANWVYKADFLEDFLVLIDAFAQLPSWPQIYVSSPPPFYSNPYGLDNNVVRGEIDPLMAQLPTYRDVKLIDTYTPLRNARDLIQADGVHFTPEGARVVAEIVAATILGMRGTPDFNGDGKVDIQDLLILIEHWGQPEPSLDIAPPPLGDGKIDASDLEAFMEYWGREVNDPALVAHWKLDEAEGETATDSAGISDGILINNPTWQPACGKRAGALLLDGIDDYISTAFVLNPTAGPFSVFAWVKDGLPGQVIVSQSQKDGVNWLLADSPQGRLATHLSAPAGRFPAKPLVSESVITDGQWHRVGFVWDGKTRALYVDNSQVASDTQTSLAKSTGGLYIGAGSTLATGTFWSGLMDDVRIYDRAVKP